MGLVNCRLLSVSIFSKSLNLVIVSVFSISCIFGIGVGFCLSLSVFILFGEVSADAGGCVRDLLSFDLISVGDFVQRVLSVVCVVLLLFSPQYRFSPIRSVFGRMILLCYLQDPFWSEACYLQDPLM